MTTDVLPNELLEALSQREQAQMKHNWMYSFMPVEHTYPAHNDFKTTVFVVGYCKVCNQSVSAPVRLKRGDMITSYAGIPKWGCIPDQEV